MPCLGGPNSYHYWNFWPRASYVPDRCFIVGMLTCLLLIMHGFATWVPHQLYCRMVYFCKVGCFERKSDTQFTAEFLQQTQYFTRLDILITFLNCWICSDLYFICIHYYLVHVYAIMACGKGRERVGAQKDNAILVKARHCHSRILLHSIVCFHW